MRFVTKHSLKLVLSLHISESLTFAANSRLHKDNKNTKNVPDVPI